jgi:hypothetical protein
MSDRFQNNPQQPPKPLPSDHDDREFYLRKREQGGIPWWVWLAIAVPLLGIVVLFCGGIAAGLLVARSAPPPAAVPVVPAPAVPAAPQPNDK